MYSTNKEKTAAIQDAIFNGTGLYPLSFFDTRRYVQHNVTLDNGIGAVLQLVDSFKGEALSVKVCRTLEDGDIAVAHNDYELGSWGKMIGFEIHRWEDGRIVEHWDNLQVTAPEPNASGRTMTDGATEVMDLDRTAENKALVERFTEDVLVGRQLDGMDGFFAGGALIQHSPLFGDGVMALRTFLERGERVYKRHHRVIGEGNMVLVMSEGTMPGEGGAHADTAYYDLYRVEAGAIAEHWEVVEVIAPRDAWVHDNGKF